MKKILIVLFIKLFYLLIKPATLTETPPRELEVRMTYIMPKTHRTPPRRENIDQRAIYRAWVENNREYAEYCKRLA